MTKTYHPIRSLVWKEWREQRWRFALSALVLTTLSASMVRAQLIPTAESVAIIFGPLGLVLSVFMSMGAVPPERAAGTWHFLVTQPMSFGRIVIVKWAVGALSLVATLIIAGLAAFAATIGHGVPPAPPRVSDLHVVYGVYDNPDFLMTSMVVSACSGYFAMYSFLFWAMLRAKSELHAGLAGVLLTIVILAWAAQYPISQGDLLARPVASLAWALSLANPLSPVLFHFEHSLLWHGFSLLFAPFAWAGIPILRWRNRSLEVVR